MTGFLTGTGQVMDPAEAVVRFLDALGVAPERIPPDLDAQAALYRSQLSGRRVLIVLDNARDTVQVRPLLPGAPTCLVLVTSRNRLTGLVAGDGAHPVTLDLLTEAEARQLLARRIGPDRVAAEPEAVENLITACARLPLALAIVAARAATVPHLPLDTFVGQLRDASGRLGALSTDDRTPTCGRCSPGPTRPSPRRPRGCSGCWVCTPARIHPPPRRPASPPTPSITCGRYWSS
jgi:hypothetical protein